MSYLKWHHLAEGLSIQQTSTAHLCRHAAKSEHPWLEWPYISVKITAQCKRLLLAGGSVIRIWRVKGLTKELRNMLRILQ
jgi:hypothetical protein